MFEYIFFLFYLEFMFLIFVFGICVVLVLFLGIFSGFREVSFCFRYIGRWVEEFVLRKEFILFYCGNEMYTGYLLEWVDWNVCFIIYWII